LPEGGFIRRAGEAHEFLEAKRMRIRPRGKQGVAGLKNKGEPG
jgi:hypothetical protein